MKAKRAIALGIALALTAAGCGSDSKESSSTTAPKQEEPKALRLWLNGEDTKQEWVDQALAEFKTMHPDVTVTFERQQWKGLVDKLNTALSSTDSPDVVELGNTQTPQFVEAGALADITDRLKDLGGSDLLQSFIDGATSADGAVHGVPYYAGARIVIYRKDLLSAAGLSVPTKLDDFITAGAKLKEANAATPNFSGIYFPGKYWYGALPFVWDAGGDIAVREGQEWKGTLSSEDSLAGLANVKRIMDTASAAPKDGDETNDWKAFCANEVGMLIGPGWKVGQILDPKDGCPAMADKLGAFALPGNNTSTAPAFLGGSHLAVSAKSKSPNYAADLIKVMTGAKFQTTLAENGLMPARKSLLSKYVGDPAVPGSVEAAKAQAAAAANDKFVPVSKNWTAVEESSVLTDLLVSIAQGADAKAEAEKADKVITETLNR